MHFVFTTVDLDGQGELHVLRSRGVSDLIGAAIWTANDKLFCERGSRCLLDPPVWTYLLGGDRRYSLGALLWHVGLWAASRYYGMTELSTHDLTHEEMVRQYGWDAADLGAVDG
jgi:hypothetical protein